MTADEQRIRVQQVLDAFTAGEMDRAVAWFDPDVVVHEARACPMEVPTEASRHFWGC